MEEKNSLSDKYAGDVNTFLDEKSILRYKRVLLFITLFSSKRLVPVIPHNVCVITENHSLPLPSNVSARL